VINPLRLAFSGRPYIENYRWKPELGTKIHLMPRAGSSDGVSFQADARFAFHHVNSYEDGEDVVVDVCTYPDAGVVEDLYLERLRDGKPIAAAQLERFRLSPRSGEVVVERLVDEPLELPRINYGRCHERPHRYVWGVGVGSGWIDRIVKADVVSRTSAVWHEEGTFPGEPVFVGAPNAEDEDEGVLLSVVLDGRLEHSFLLVLDARTLEELARAEVPHHIPFGFHGQFVR
jgi:carotenoid cleavage dioxygenase-like enzyme